MRFGRKVNFGEDVHVGVVRLLPGYLARAVVAYDPRDKLGAVAYGPYLGDTGYLVRRAHDADDPELRDSRKNVLHVPCVAAGKVPAPLVLVVAVALGHDAKLESQQPLEGVRVVESGDVDVLTHHEVHGYVTDAAQVRQASGIGKVVGHAPIVVADDDRLVVGAGHVACHDLVGAGARPLVIGNLAQQRSRVRQNVRDGPLAVLAKDVVEREVVEDGCLAVPDDLPAAGIIEVDADVVVTLDVVGVLPDVRASRVHIAHELLEVALLAVHEGRRRDLLGHVAERHFVGGGVACLVILVECLKGAEGDAHER